MRLSKEIKTAIVVLGGVVLFYLGFNYLKSSPVFENSRIFYSVYHDVGGLERGNHVTINGLSVGKIQNIDFKDASGKLLVTFVVDSDYEFSKHSLAELYDTGIIGGKAIAIKPIFDGSEIAKSGDTLQAATKQGLTDLVQQKITPLQVQLENTLVNANKVLVNLNTVLNDENKNNLTKVLKNMNQTMVNFKNSSNALSELLQSNETRLNSSLDNFHKITTDFSKLSDTLSHADIGGSLRQMKKAMGQLNEVLVKVNSGKGSLGKLMNDEKMYGNLTQASKQLELLLKDMRLHPKRYVHFSVFGKKDKGFKGPVEGPQPQN